MTQRIPLFNRSFAFLSELFPLRFPQGDSFQGIFAVDFTTP